MKEPLKVGDRVAVYERVRVGTGTIERVSLDGDGIDVRLDGPINGLRFFHEKQCRRLKPKRERRRVWLHVDALKKEREEIPFQLFSFDADEDGLDPDGNWIEFREVRKK